jgi:hypothetical protein
MSKQMMRVYASGGCGINLAYKVGKDVEVSKQAAHFADLEIAYIDTAESNFFADILEEQRLVPDTLYGSGKKRDENHEVVLDPKFLDEVFRRFPPGVVNIVVHAAGGGSGAVIGYGLVDALMERGESVIAMVVGSTSTRLDALNTSKTLKSYDGLVATHSQPLALFYRENSRTISRENVDSDVYEALMSLAVLWSGNNRELDRRDLENWLRYDRVTSHPIELNQVLIMGAGDLDTALNAGDVASVATLAAAGQPTDLDPAPEVQFVGFFQKNSTTEAIEKQLPIHFVLTRSYFGQISDQLDETLDSHKKIEQTRSKNAPLLKKTDVQTKRGLVV